MNDTCSPLSRRPGWFVPGMGLLAAVFTVCSAGLAIEVEQDQGDVIMMELEDNAGVIPGLEGFAELEPFDADEEVESESKRPTSKSSQNDGQTLHFSGGYTLHGSLASIDSQRRELSWQHSDFSSPITFPLGEVASLSMTGNKESGASTGKITVKLTGSDWLAADSVALKDGKLEIRLGGGSPLVIDRERVEWLYFSKTSAPECYDGPTSMAGWISDGSWTFREGTLRALRPGPIGRHFESLPDQVEYLFELDQNGGFQAFSVNLRSNQPTTRGESQGRLQIMFSASDLRMWAQIGDEMKMEQVDLQQVLGSPDKPDGYRPPRNKAVQYRILEDFPAGRIIIFIDGRKAADWSIAKGDTGKNRGGFTFQPMVWNADSQQTISRVRVVPWDGIVPADGPMVDERANSDSVVVTGAEPKKGEVFELGANKLKLRAGDTVNEISREQIRLLRFRRPEIPPDEDAPVARIRLMRRGEFDVSGMSVQGGQFAVRTSFGGEVAFPFAAIRAVEFAGTAPSAASAADVLVFKNGDRLRGSLEGGANGQPFRWRANGATTTVDVQPGNLLGVLLSAKESPAGKLSALARFRNGDLLPGEFAGLDGERLQLNTAHAGPLAIPRAQLRALYFAKDGVAPVLDGTMGTELWMTGAELRRAAEAKREKPASGSPVKPAQAIPWRYFDGTFTLQRPEGSAGTAYRGSIYLGRLFEAMPQSVEISFHVAAAKLPPIFSVQLFSEPNSPGYMMQCYSEGIFLHDMSPRGRGRAVFQQQFPFGNQVGTNVLQRHVRIFADRPSGRVTIVVDGAVVGEVVRKASDGARNLGRGFMVLPQTNTSCTFSDFWIGPWNGLVPGREPSGGGSDQEKEHTVLLANGDETRGTTLSASPETLKFESEVGPVELPIARLTMIDLGSIPPSKPERGVRLRLAGSGTLTVTSYRIESGNVVCQSAVAGELKLPLSVVQEIALPISTSTVENGGKKKPR